MPVPFTSIPTPSDLWGRLHPWLGEIDRRTQQLFGNELGLMYTFEDALPHFIPEPAIDSMGNPIDPVEPTIGPAGLDARDDSQRRYFENIIREMNKLPSDLQNDPLAESDPMRKRAGPPVYKYEDWEEPKPAGPPPYTYEDWEAEHPIVEPYLAAPFYEGGPRRLSPSTYSYPESPEDGARRLTPSTYSYDDRGNR
jgi:hypothetical protein